MKNKIGWCSETWNPVIGCRNSCIYCYAKRINDRFKFIEKWDIPEWRKKSFNKRFPRGPQKIFIGSMSEIYYWDEVWIQKVIEKIKQYPQHIFQFLTKYPCVYRKIVSYTFPKNCWLGITITDNKDSWYSDFRVGPGNTDLIKFVSIEPILEMIEPESLHHLEMDWVIIGAESGQRPGRVTPKKEWIGNIVKFCQDNNIPIYLKNSLRGIYPVEIKEFPETKAELKLF